MIDLHVHSTASDGSLTPGELVQRATQSGLTAIALTDHDTVSGLQEFREAGGAASPQTIPGVEIGACWYGGSLHILGLFIDAENRLLRRLLDRIRAARQDRNHRIVAALCRLGFEVDWRAIQAFAGGETIGRPHIAQALTAAGCCTDVRQAFDRLLGKGQPAYCQRWLPQPAAAIRVIHRAGGLAVWAHPFGLSRRPPAKVRQIARHLQRHGLDAMETHYSLYDEWTGRKARGIAAELGLLETGGSDFHGITTPGIGLGTGAGALEVPDALVAALEARAAARHRAGAGLPPGSPGS